MTFRIGPLTSAHLDAATGLAALNGSLEPDHFKKALSRARNPGYYCLVAVDKGSHELLGFLSARPDSPMLPDQAVSRVSVTVDREQELFEVDRWLLRAFETFADRHAIRRLRGRARGGDRQSIAFFERNGFIEDHRMCYLALDMADLPRSLPSPEEAFESLGVTIAGLPYDAIDAPLLARLVDVMDASARDWPPYYDEPAVPATAANVSQLLQGGETMSICLVIAEDRDHQIVGFSNFRPSGDGSILRQGITAVRHSHAGLGIGQALKARVIDFARDGGYTSIETYNRSDNAAMLHINEKFGFRRLSEEVRFAKSLA